jgi:hypothetical protein
MNKKRIISNKVLLSIPINKTQKILTLKDLKKTKPMRKTVKKVKD